MVHFSCSTRFRWKLIHSNTEICSCEHWIGIGFSFWSKQVTSVDTVHDIIFTSMDRVCVRPNKPVNEQEEEKYTCNCV